VYVAYYLHWPFELILGLEHRTRARVIDEVGAIHRLLDEKADA
jgi:hypothetical protein